MGSCTITRAAVIDDLEQYALRVGSASKEEQREIALRVCSLIVGYGKQPDEAPLNDVDFDKACVMLGRIFGPLGFTMIASAAKQAHLSTELFYFICGLGKGEKSALTPTLTGNAKKESVVFCEGDEPVVKLSGLSVTVNSIRYEQGTLAIDAQVPALYVCDENLLRWSLKVDDKSYPMEATGQYVGLYLFGHAFQSGHFLRAVLDSSLLKGSVKVSLCVTYDDGRIRASHPLRHEWRTRSHLASRKRQYWACGDKIFRGYKSCFTVNPRSWWNRAKAEVGLIGSLLLSGKKGRVKVALIRCAYWATRPLYTRKRIWIFYDKAYMGGDSGEHLCRYVAEQSDRKILPVFVIEKEAPPVPELKKGPFKLAFRGTLRHKLLYLNAEVVWGTHSLPDRNNKFTEKNSVYLRDLLRSRLFSIQHYVAMQDVAVLIRQGEVAMERFYGSSHYEVDHLLEPKYGYVQEQMVVSGLPRFNDLYDKSEKEILISPTWRPEAASKARGDGKSRSARADFKDSDFYKVYNALINDESLLDAARKAGYTITLLLHPCIMANKGAFDVADGVRVVAPGEDGPFESFLCEAKLMVTDYSGVQYDFAYMDKTVLYLHMKEFPPQYANEAMDYETMGFGEVTHSVSELVGLLCSYIERDCEPTEETLRRIHDFFDYQDHDICKRIYEDALEYLQEPIPKKVLTGISPILF